VISGEMSKWRRYYHGIMTGFSCLFLVAVGSRLALGLFRFRAAASRPETSVWIFSLLFVALVVLSVGMQLRFLRRLIVEFAFDGSSFRFRTLGIGETQTRALPEIAEVLEWRGGSRGYRLVFQDRQKVYLENEVSNSMAVTLELKGLLKKAQLL
jgi:hypothetical protein